MFDHSQQCLLRHRPFEVFFPVTIIPERNEKLCLKECGLHRIEVVLVTPTFSATSPVASFATVQEESTVMHCMEVNDPFCLRFKPQSRR